jgi:THO complex subunit 1
VQIIGDQDQCEPITVWYLIEDLLDSQDIEGSRSVFDYLESRREYLVGKNFQKISLVVLRACNELLRRLSKAEDAVFCGRVFIFVFQCFPLGDRSAVNRHGTYNDENITVFDNIESNQQEDPNGDTVMEDSTTEKTANNTDAKDMDQLYATFWGLQKSFAFPPSVFDPGYLESFKKAFQATLEKFKNMKSVLSTTDFEERQNNKRKADDTAFEDNYKNLNPKYLTSRELFELELSDLAFRRHILVQALILIHFLLSFTEKAKNKQILSRTQLKTKFTLSEEDVS